MQLAHILQSLYRTTELDEVPVHKLQETLREHPYFGTAHFLLARKLKQQHSDQYEEQAQKAAIYFHDPLWMQWQLSHGLESPVETQASAVANTESLGAEVSHRDNESSFSQVEMPQPELHENTEASAGQVEVPLAESHAEAEEPVSFVENLDLLQTPESVTTEPEAAETTRPEMVTTTEADRVETPATEPFEAAAPQIVETTEAQIVETAEAQTVETAEAQTEQTEWPLVAETTENNNGVEEPEPSSEVIRAEIAERPVEETQPVFQPASGTEIQQPDASTSPAAEKEPVAFDPYYTIDYFAYQGIKAPTEVQPGDKLGKQLKSFTEWLKTMKRLPQATAEDEADETEQQNIQRFAAGSLEGKQVVTETMAEVLVKQDRKEEAIGIYQKLSLLDPSKSAYFAAKIENLKSELT